MVELARSPRLTSLPFLKTKIVAAIPCFNTQSAVAAVIAGARRFVDEVIVIDDGSRDMTADVARAAGAIVISHGFNKGYGEAIKSCIASAKARQADALVIIDGDGQHNPEEIPRFLTPIITGEADLVIGSRFLIVSKGMPCYRRMGICIINWVWNLGSRVKVSDTQSGFRAYNRDLLSRLHFSETGMSISIEILEKARKIGTRIKEVPITCSYEDNNATFSLKAFRHGFGVASAVLRIRLKHSLARVI